MDKSGMDLTKIMAMSQQMTIEQQKELFKAVQALQAKPGAGGQQAVPMELFQMLMNQQSSMAQHLIVDQYDSDDKDDDSDIEDDSESEELEQEEGELKFDSIQKKKAP